MRHTENRRGLQIDLETRECVLPEGILAGLQAPLDQIADGIDGLPASLEMIVVYHPKSDRYHADGALRLPRGRLFTGDRDADLDTVMHRSLRKLRHKLDAYRQEPDRAADEAAKAVAAMNRQIVAPEDPDAGALGAALEEGDYGRFRKLLAGYEDWLRLRIGRWIQRYPEFEDELGARLNLGDLVEEVFLNAFEYHAQRPVVGSVRDWLEDWIDPSLRALAKNLLEERENVSQVRTLREATLP